jgi:hypothetical protein
MPLSWIPRTSAGAVAISGAHHAGAPLPRGAQVKAEQPLPDQDEHDGLGQAPRLHHQRHPPMASARLQCPRQHLRLRGLAHA